MTTAEAVSLGSRVARAILAVGLVVAAAMPSIGGERWGWLGIRIRDLTEAEMEEIAARLGFGEGYGVVIAEILKDSPAESSELRPGDLIVAIDGRPVVETRALQRLVGSADAGRVLSVVVLRENRRRELRVHVGQMPAEVVAERVAADFGFLVREPSGEDLAAPGAELSPVVAAIGERSSAARAGLVAGDRILALNGGQVGSIENLRRRLQDLLLRDEIRLRVLRRGEPLDLTLPPAKPLLPLQ